jgi:chemotaxis protein MotA
MQKHISKPMAIAVCALIALIAATLMYGASVYRSFLNLEGLVIVIGGSVANAFLSYQREDVLKAFDTIRHMLDKPPAARDALHKDIMQMISWSYVVQAEDLVGLDKVSAQKINDPLLRYGMDLVVSGYSADNIREMMQTVAEAESERRCVPVNVLRNMAATAPAFGMVGTLVGMVIILNNVGFDISNIGGGLGVAMLSTLYGLLAARLVCLPAADKLMAREDAVFFRNCMMSEGFALLSEKQKPFYVQDKLNSFLEPSRHIAFEDRIHHVSRRKLAMVS